jgi:fumarylacetoacetase
VINQTHDPAIKSWLSSANAVGAPFPIQNLPFGVFSRAGAQDRAIGVRIGDAVLNLRQASPYLALPEAVRAVLAEPTLNPWMGLPQEIRAELRAQIFHALQSGADHRAAMEDALTPIDQAEMHLPVAIGAFVDFFACMNHALTTAAVLRRGEPGPLLTNFMWMPLAYHGRSASVTTAATVRRPWGQRRPQRDAPPVFEPSRELDFETELGALIGPGCANGARITIAEAARNIAGYVIVNDWSARDIQTWEGGPMGPMQSKSFATTISPWVVTSEALAPFRAPAFARPAEHPTPLPYLHDAEDQANGGLDITLEASLRTASMRDRGDASHIVSRSSAHEMYWTPQQMLAHYTANGGGVSAGDLLASGTISGASDGARGCLLEATQRGRAPLTIGAETRGFLEDGDEVKITALCQRAGFVPIGFGECKAIVLSAAQA